MNDLFTKQEHVYLIYFIVKKACNVKVSWKYCQHLMIILNRSRCFIHPSSEWLSMYLLTLPSPPCNCVDKPWLVLFCFFVKNACKKKPCPRNAICQAGFSSEGYRCVCVPGYTGEDCTEGEADIRVQYLSISSHLTIMKVGDGNFSTLLMHFFKFFCRGWRKSSGELWDWGK